MTELLGLLAHAKLWPQQPTMMVATLATVSDLDLAMKQFTIGECNRRTPRQILSVWWKSLLIVIRERPDLIVTTGSLPLAIFSLTARICGAKIIWIDSISQVDDISMSGKLVKPFSSQFYVQWPDLAQRFDDTLYKGELV